MSRLGADLRQRAECVLLFGAAVAADFSLPPAKSVAGPAELTIHDDPSLRAPKDALPLRLPLPNPDGGREVRVWGELGAVVLDVEGVAVFRVSRDRIAYRMTFALPIGSLHWQLFGLVASVWLELRSQLVFHGAAVAINGRAVGLIGPSGRGKSTLAVALGAFGGRVLADDHLIVEATPSSATAHPALPWAKLDRPSADVLGIDFGQLSELHARSKKRRFNLPDDLRQDTPTKLAGVFVLQVGAGGPPAISPPLTPVDALRRLLVHSSVPRTVAAAGWEPDRLRRLAAVIEAVPVFDLEVPRDLARVHQTAHLLADFGGRLDS